MFWGGGVGDVKAVRANTQYPGELFCPGLGDCRVLGECIGGAANPGV